MGEAEIRKMLQSTNQISLGLDAGPEANTHALDEVQSFIGINSRNHMKTSMKSVKDRFMKAPYGYVDDDIHWLIARLFKRGDLAFTVNGASVSLNSKPVEEIIGFITKKAFVEKLLIEERVRVNDKDKKAVRDVMKEVFHTSSSSEDEDSIMKDFQRYAQNIITEIDRLEVFYKQYKYPGKKVLESGKHLMLSVIQPQSPIEFFADISKRRDEFTDFAEDYEPVKAFFSGEQQQIFTRALDMLAIYDDSKTYIVDDELESLVKQMRQIVQQETPYGNIPKLPDLRDKFADAYAKVLDAEQKPVLDRIDQAWQRVMEVLDGKEYKEEKRHRYYELFQEFRDGAEHCNNVSTLRSFADKADALKIRLLNEMAALDAQISKKKAEEEAKAEAEQNEGKSDDVPAKIKAAPAKLHATKNIAIKKLTGTASWSVNTMDDVDKYLSELREKLAAQLDEDTTVNVEF
jgi:hypothetical protein